MTRPVPASATGIVSLADCLERAVEAMWPRRAQQELLLDLGERKEWDLANRRVAVEGAGAWLIRELGLPPSVSVDAAAPRAGEDGVEHARSLARTLGRVAQGEAGGPYPSLVLGWSHRGSGGALRRGQHPQGVRA